MSTEDAAIGFDSPAPRIKIPYSVSTPQIFRMATTGPYSAPRRTPSGASLRWLRWDRRAIRRRWQGSTTQEATGAFKEEDAASGGESRRAPKPFQRRASRESSETA